VILIPNLTDTLNDRDSKNFRKKYRSYLSDLKGYLKWGGCLPSTSIQVIEYLYANEDQKSPGTLRRHLASISWWHRRCSHFDITKSPDVNDAMVGIAGEHNRPTKQALPLMFENLARIVAHIDIELEDALGTVVLPSNNQMKLLRDRTLLCVGWWRAFRASDISQLRVQDIRQSSSGFNIYIRKGKGDRDAKGVDYPMVPVDDQYRSCCPVDSLNAWLLASQLDSGPLFPSIRSMNNKAPKPLSSDLINSIVKEYSKRVGLVGYSSHSLRAGFTTQFQDSMTLVNLTDYVGWSSLEHARRYRRGVSALPFQQKLES
jgi:integrase